MVIQKKKKKFAARNMGQREGEKQNRRFSPRPLPDFLICAECLREENYMHRFLIPDLGLPRLAENWVLIVRGSHILSEF